MCSYVQSSVGKAHLSRVGVIGYSSYSAFRPFIALSRGVRFLLVTFQRLSLLPSLVWRRAARHSGGSHHLAVLHSGFVNSPYDTSLRAVIGRMVQGDACVVSWCRVPRGGAVALTSTPRQERTVQLLSNHVNVLSRQHYSLCGWEDDDLQALQYIRSSAVSLSTPRSIQPVELCSSVRGRLGKEAGLGLPVLIGWRHFRQLCTLFLSPYHFRRDGDSIQVSFRGTSWFIILSRDAQATASFARASTTWNQFLLGIVHWLCVGIFRCRGPGHCGHECGFCKFVSLFLTKSHLTLQCCRRGALVESWVDEDTLPILRGLIVRCSRVCAYPLVLGQGWTGNSLGWYSRFRSFQSPYSLA